MGIARLACSVLLAIAAQSAMSPPARTPIVLGIDHVPVAVSDLAAAADRYRALGFVLKPGRPHANGIRNEHAKFPDGTEIELITAPAAVDTLTRKYRKHLEAGDGPAFLALFAPAEAQRAKALSADTVPYVFFGPRQASPTDRPEHFAHPNSAFALKKVWLAGDDLDAERTLFAALGARLRTATVHVPEPVAATVAEFQDGSVVILPGSRQIVPGRPIVGMTVAVRDVTAASRILGGRARRGASAASIYASPADTNGYWLEFNQAPGVAAVPEEPRGATRPPR